MSRNRTGWAIGILAIGIGMALWPVAIASAGQNGSTSNHGSQHKQKHGNSQSSPQTAKFCSYYISAVDIYQSNAGAFTHEDPALKRMVADLEKAQSVAPAAIKKYVTAMVKATKSELTARNPNEMNLSGPSGHISNWGNSHCPSGNSGNSGNSGSSNSNNSNNSNNSGNSGASGNSGNSGTSGNSGSSARPRPGQEA